MSTNSPSDKSPIDALAADDLMYVSDTSAADAIKSYTPQQMADFVGLEAGSGDVIGPASSTDNAVVRFDSTTGKLIQNSGVTIDDSDNIAANNLSGTNTGDQTTITGNAGTATALETARTIGGVSFDGTANIVPDTITFANEATDTTCFVTFSTAATGDLGPKTNTGLTYNSNTSILTATGFAGPLTGNVTGDASGTAATVTGAAQAAITSLGTLTTLTVDNLTVNGNTITADTGALNLTPASGSAIVLDGTINVDAGVVTGATSITSTAFVGALTGNADTVTTNANLTGHITSTGNAAVLGSFTSAQLATALTNETGSGSAVFGTSPTLTTPTIGVATATTVNKITITAPATAGTLTIVEGATLTASATASVSGTNTGDIAFWVGSGIENSPNTIAGFDGAAAAESLTRTGAGTVVVMASNATLVNPALGTPASGVMTNVTGTAASLTAGNVTTNANLTGHITSTGNAAVLGSFTLAQLNTASSETLKFAGKETIWMPASAMTGALTSGASTTQLETSSNKVNYWVFDFDDGTDEYTHFDIAFPKSWDEGTVTFQVLWECATAVTTGIAMGLQGVFVSDNVSADTAYGTAIVVTDDAQGAAGELYVSAVSSAVTIAGTPAVDGICNFRLLRDVSDGNDDLVGDARIRGVNVFYTTDAGNDD